jgi:hypothetical protein
MACDPGRTQQVLRWCLIDAKPDSDDFMHKRTEMIAGAATNNARTVYDRAIAILDGHDHVGANLVKECGEGNALTWFPQVGHCSDAVRWPDDFP